MTAYLAPAHPAQLSPGPGRLVPAVTAALMAPIDVPMTQTGSIPASCSAWYTPT